MEEQDITLLRHEALEKINEVQSKKVAYLSGRKVPEGVYSEELRVPVRRGAFVISVEGEEFIGWGNKKYEGVGFLGRLIGLERYLDGYLLYFTYGNEGWDERGERLGRPNHIKHPLCENGYFVPEDGLKILDYGDVILISKTGIFSGESYSELAKKYRERYLKVYQMYFDIKQKYEELIGQNQTLAEELNVLKASREDWLYYASEITAKYHLVYDTYMRFKHQYEGLMVMLDKMVDVDATLRESLKYELSTLDKRINDMLALFEHFKIEESIRAEGMNLPKLTPEMREYYKRKIISKSGLGTLKDMEKELENKEKESEQTKENMRKMIEYIRQLEERLKKLEKENAELKKEKEKTAEVQEKEVEEGGEEEAESEEEGEEKEGIVSRILRR